MSYSNRSSFFLKVKSIAQDRTSSTHKKIASGFFFIIALLIFCIPIANKQLQNLDDFLDVKLERIYTKMAVINSKLKSTAERFVNIFSLIETNETLKNENEILKTTNSKLEHVLLENENLKQMNNFVFPKTQKILSTRLIFRSDGQTGIAKIFAGASDGIKTGQIVVSSTGALLGKIIQVSDKSSKILLINEPKSKLSVTFSRTNNKAILSGNYGETLKISLAGLSTDIKDGDVVITAGDDGYLPAGLLVGTVKLAKDQEAKVIPMISPSNVGFVSILELEEKR